jgi:hypothetical protein
MISPHEAIQKNDIEFIEVLPGVKEIAIPPHNISSSKRIHLLTTRRSRRLFKGNLNMPCPETLGLVDRVTSTVVCKNCKHLWKVRKLE